VKPQTKGNTWPILPTRYGLLPVDADHQKFKTINARVDQNTKAND